jgi:hypothetical protein
LMKRQCMNGLSDHWSALLPHDITFLSGSCGQQLNQRIGAQLEPYRWRIIRVAAIRLNGFLAFFVSVGGGKRLFEACKRRRNISGKHGARDGSGVPRHLQEKYSNITEHGDVAPRVGMKGYKHWWSSVEAPELIGPLRKAGPRLEMIVAGDEESDQSDHDQIDGDNGAEQTRHDKNKNARDQRYQRGETQ